MSGGHGYHAVLCFSEIRSLKMIYKPAATFRGPFTVSVEFIVSVTLITQ